MTGKIPFSIMGAGPGPGVQGPGGIYDVVIHHGATEYVGTWRVHGSASEPAGAAERFRFSAGASFPQVDINGGNNDYWWSVQHVDPANVWELAWEPGTAESVFATVPENDGFTVVDNQTQQTNNPNTAQMHTGWYEVTSTDVTTNATAKAWIHVQGVHQQPTLRVETWLLQAGFQWPRFQKYVWTHLKMVNRNPAGTSPAVNVEETLVYTVGRGWVRTHP